VVTRALPMMLRTVTAATVTDRPGSGSDHDLDLAAVCRRRVEREATADPASPMAATEVLTLRHREVNVAGARPEELLALGAATDRAVERFPTWPDLRLLRATVALAVHRADVARSSLAAVPGLVELPAGRVVAADLAQFEGDYEAARVGYERALQEEPRWDTVARLAELAVATGRFDDADDLFAAAENELTAKQLRPFASLRVRRAELAVGRGNVGRAKRFLDDADHAYAGWWFVTLHRAALDAARGRHERAVVGYRTVLAQVDRPDIREALGTELAAAGQADAAAECHATAVAAYLVSAARGEVHCLHHLATFYADVHPHAAAALSWAQADVELRRTGSTLSTLAWCQYRAGRTAEALATLDVAFAMGAGDPVLQARARVIRGTR
jgi:tetratricopeptide (TPR) repeat protein